MYRIYVLLISIILNIVIIFTILYKMHSYSCLDSNVIFAILCPLCTVFAAVPIIELLLGGTLTTVIRWTCLATFFFISPILSWIVMYKDGKMKKMFSDINFILLLVGSFMILIPIFVFASLDVYNKYPYDAILYGCIVGGVFTWILGFVEERNIESNDDSHEKPLVESNNKEPLLYIV